MKSCENFSQMQKLRISLLSDAYNYNIDGYVTFIPGIMNFIDNEEQPLFLILKVYFVVKLSKSCKAYQLNEKNPDELTLLRISSMVASSIKKVLKLVDRMKIKELRTLVYKSGRIFCLPHSNKCQPLASEKFVLASESNLSLATGLGS